MRKKHRIQDSIANMKNSPITKSQTKITLKLKLPAIYENIVYFIYLSSALNLASY